MGRMRYTMAALSCTMSYFAYCMLEPILAQRLKDDFDVSPANISLFFVTASFMYIPACIFASWLPKRIERRVVLILASVCCAFAYLFVGPSQLLKFPDTIGMMTVGQVLLGCALPFQFVPVLPEMTEYACQFYHESEHARVKNYSSGVFTAFIGLG